MEETNTNTTPSSGLLEYISDAAKKLTDVIKNKNENITKDTATGIPEMKIGGARSRRRGCNKKHRHTKSCRKNVKKGRKTRKH